MAEPRNPAQIELGRRSLISLGEKIRRDAIHLGAERPATKALKHPAIRKIEVEHCAPLRLRRGRIPRRRKRHEKLCGGENGTWPSTSGLRPPPPHNVTRHIRTDLQIGSPVPMR